MKNSQFADKYFFKKELESLDWSDFTEVILTEAECGHQHLLTEAGRVVDRKTLKLATDAGRILRSKDDVNIVDWKIRKGYADPAKYGKGYKIIEYSVLADPTIENRIHHGYVVYFASNRKVREVWCDCKDYFFRLYYVYVKAGISTYNLDAAYKRFMVAPIEKRPPVETNPSGRLFACKHLLHIFDNVLDLSKLSELIDDTAIEDEKKAKEIEKQTKDKLATMDKAKKPVEPEEELDDTETPPEEEPASKEPPKSKEEPSKEKKPMGKPKTEVPVKKKEEPVQKKSLGKAVGNALKDKTPITKPRPTKPTKPVEKPKKSVHGAAKDFLK